jgi:hypothetical protein
VVVEHLRRVGELYRDDVVAGVAGLEVTGDEREVLLAARAGIHHELRGSGAVTLGRRLLQQLVSGHDLGPLEASDPYPRELLGCSSLRLLEDPWRPAHLGRLERAHRAVAGPPQENNGERGQEDESRRAEQGLAPEG